MKFSSLKQKAEAIKDRREMLIRSVRAHLIPVLITEGFEVAPLAKRGPIDRELVLSLPLGRLRRQRAGGVDLLEIDFAKYRRAAFRINAGVAPQCGIMTLSGHWSAEDVYIGWLNEYFTMYASPRWRIQFRVWCWPHQSPAQSDYDKLAKRVAEFLPELEAALREGRTGRHIRRWVTPRSTSSQSDAVAG